MTQERIDHLLDELQSDNVPQPNAQARKHAINLANQTFDQAFSEPARPKTKSTDSYLRRFFMSIFSKQPLNPKFGYAFGTVAVVALAVPLLLNYDFNNNDFDQALSNTPIAPTTAPNTQASSPHTNKKQSETTQSRPKPQQPMPVDTNSSNSAGSDAAEMDAERFALEEIVTTAVRTEAPIAQQKPQVKLESRIQTEPKVRKANSPQQAKQAPAVSSTQRSSRADVLSESSADSAVSFETLSSAAPVNIGRLRTQELKTQSAARPDLQEQYPEFQRSSVTQVGDQPISTFSADVDTASYSLVRNQLNRGYLPAQNAVRAEEFINYFDYNYALPKSKAQPFKPSVSVVDSPWNEGKKLIHIGIKGYDIEPSETPDSNIVFLMDVSGSMGDINKLPLAKQAVQFLANQLKPTDKISIAVYAGAAGVVLEPTDASDKAKLTSALSSLNAGGSTAGGAGIELAYHLAEQHFDKNAVNRIVLLTDGDFNVGQSSNQALQELVERKRESGVFLSVLGFGRNNYQDDMMQTLAQNGNGVAAYIDTLSEAKKVLVDEATSSLFPIAKDVKFQVEFNPATVSDYRLVGYETRALKTEDFNNDKVDAGDIGAGHTVTAIYEITPSNTDKPSIDQPRYTGNQKSTVNQHTKKGANDEYGFLKVRYKLPNESKSKLISLPIKTKTSNASSDVAFSIATAGFAQLLNGSPHTGNLNYADVAKQAKSNKGTDPFGYRAEFIQLVEMAQLIK